MTPKENQLPMESAPKDGTLIIVGSPDVGEFPMRWVPSMVNLLVGPSPRGMWVSQDNSFTWDEAGGFGPEYWVHATH